MPFKQSGVCDWIVMVRIDMTQKKVDADFEEAKRIRKENPKDPSGVCFRL